MLEAFFAAVLTEADFNPTLVQLEFHRESARFLLACKFQSHIGAIRITSQKMLSSTTVSFQSHIGAIRIDEQKFKELKHRYFNPTLVQLEWMALGVDTVFALDFNPTLVQLESLTK